MDRYTINVSFAERVALLDYLNGDISSRELGTILGISHQGSINFVAQICRQWVQQGHLEYREALSTRVLPPIPNKSNP